MAAGASHGACSWGVCVNVFADAVCVSDTEVWLLMCAGPGPRGVWLPGWGLVQGLPWRGCLVVDRQMVGFGGTREQLPFLLLTSHPRSCFFCLLCSLLLHLQVGDPWLSPGSSFLL